MLCYKISLMAEKEVAETRGNKDRSDRRLPELEMDSRNAGQCPQYHAGGLVKL